MRKILFLSILFLIAGFIITSGAQAAILIDGWNINNTPGATNTQWGATQTAWYYIPSQTYNLTRIEFYAGLQNRNNVAIQLRQNNAGEVGSVLSSGTFNHSSLFGWQGTDITPYQVIAGQSYWVSMWDVESLGANITWDQAGQIVLLRVGFDHNANNYTRSHDTYKPMAKFYGNPVPEPASLTLLGIGLLGLLKLGKRKK